MWEQMGEQMLPNPSCLIADPASAILSQPGQISGNAFAAMRMVCQNSDIMGDWFPVISLRIDFVAEGIFSDDR